MKKYYFLFVCLILSLQLLGCGKSSNIEGKVVNHKGQPIDHINVIAKMVKPIKGYEQFQTTTKSDGTFRFRKVYPSSPYIVIVDTDQFFIESAPDGETAMFTNPLKMRFMIDNEGVITDGENNLEWFVGPRENFNWYMAKAWVEKLNVAGGNWRMPDKVELRTLYIKNIAEKNETRYNIHPKFKLDKICIWSSEYKKDLNASCTFNYYSGGEGFIDSNVSDMCQAIAVRR